MMSLVVVIGLVATCTASPSLYFSGPQYYSGYYPSAVVSPIKSQYHAQNEQGQYAYGYNDGYSSKAETKHANGLTEGAYSYVDPNGVLQQYKYVSDENGYRVSGTNLPAAPVATYASAVAAAPVAVAYGAAEAPQPVQDTPEVAAAKAAHLAAHEQAKISAYAAPAPVSSFAYTAPAPVASYAVAPAPIASFAYSAPAPVASYAYTASGAASSSNTNEAPKPVQDTPEVAAAKVAHQVAFDQAKKAAEEAPADETPVDNSTPVQDTPEVAAAKAAHLAAHEQAKISAYAAPAPVSSFAYTAPAPVASYAYTASAAASSSSSAEAPQPVQDTPEVAAAKAAHQAAFDQAKKAAEEAPSDDGSWSDQGEPASDAVAVNAAVTSTVTKAAAPAVAYSYLQTAYPSYAVAAPAPAPVASYAYSAVPAYKTYAAVAPVAAYGYAAYAPFAASSYSPVHSQYHSQDELGQYSYGYNSGSSSKAEVKTLDGVTRGGYSYVDSNGIVQHYNYVSDSVNGFRVAGTNLPSNSL